MIKDAAEGLAKGLADRTRGGWILSVMLCIGGIAVLLWTVPTVGAGSTLSQTLQPGKWWIDLVFPFAGLLLVGAGLLVGVRQQRIDEMPARAPDLEARGAPESSALQSRIESVEAAVRSLDGQIGSARAVIEALSVLANRGSQESAFIGFLDGIVRLCRDRTTTSRTYSFWVKLYLAHSDGTLEARYASTSAPAGTSQHNLRKGVGAAGRFLDQYVKNQAIAPQYFPWSVIHDGLDAASRTELERRGVRSVLCAAVTAHVADPDGKGNIHFRQVRGTGESTVLFGVLCFCSTLEATETSLDSEEKKRACQFVANLAGAMFQRQRTVPGVLSAHQGLNVSRA